MDPNAKHKVRKYFTAVWWQFEDCKSTFLSPSDLRTFGIEACQVDIADDETLQFEPCFFKPHPPGVLRNHPIDVAASDYDVRRLGGIPTFQDALDEIQRASLSRQILLMRLRNYSRRGLKIITPWTTGLKLMGFIAISNTPSASPERVDSQVSVLAISPA
jgi:hypothetical protein